MGIMLVWEERKEYSEVWTDPPSLKVPIEERFWSPKGLSSCGRKGVSRRQKWGRSGKDVLPRFSTPAHPSLRLLVRSPGSCFSG